MNYRAILNIWITQNTRQFFLCIFPIKIGPNLSQQVRTGLTKPAPTFSEKNPDIFEFFPTNFSPTFVPTPETVSHSPFLLQREKVRRRLHLNFHLPPFFHILLPSPFPRDFHLHFRPKMNISALNASPCFFNCPV